MGMDYTTVTELPGQNIPQEQLERLYQRYYFASQFCEKKNVLEVACGSGPGLGMIAQKANMVIGGDIDRIILKIAQEKYHQRANISLQLMDACNLPFADNSFDVILIYEAIYYVDIDRFIGEAVRVLRKNGVFMVCSVNCEWSDFSPSPYSKNYYKASELSALLSNRFHEVRIYTAFLDEKDALKAKIVSFIKRMAVTVGLMPKTMKGKELFKRIFFGKLTPMPAELIEGMAAFREPEPISPNLSYSQYKVLYAIGERKK